MAFLLNDKLVERMTEPAPEFLELFLVIGTLFVIKEKFKPTDPDFRCSAVREWNNFLNMLPGLILGISCLFVSGLAYHRSVAPLLAMAATFVVMAFRTVVRFANCAVFVFYNRLIKVGDVIAFKDGGKQYRVTDIYIMYTVLEEVARSGQRGPRGQLFVSNAYLQNRGFWLRR